MHYHRVGRLVVGLGIALVGLGIGPAKAEPLFGISEFSDHLDTFNPATGQTLSSVVVTGTAGGFRDIVSNHAGQLLVASWGAHGEAPVGGDNVLFQLNPTTGATTAIGAITNGTGKVYWVEGMAWVNGALYGSANPYDLSTGKYEGYTNDGATELITIDPTTGHATDIGYFGSNFLNMQNIAYSPSYGLIGSDIGTLDPTLANPNDPNSAFQTFHTTPSLVKIDLTTGQATKIADMPHDPNTLISNPINNYLSPQATYVAGLDFTPDGRTLYGATIQTHFGGSNSGLVTIDPVTGAVTSIGTLNEPLVVGLTFAAVPEPSAFVLFGLGLVVVGLWRLRSS
ncbi:MAG: PEP-CTERM sorting domain-containing protein [Isosphaeraceae bacterium]